MNTRKDYERAASLVRVLFLQVGTGFENRQLNAFAAAEAVREAFVDFFRDENPRFNVERFRDDALVGLMRTEEDMR